MLDNYLKYLEFITEKLNKFFNRQKEYIFCKKGCSLCCKNAQFPYSKIEMQYLFLGCKTLSGETINKIEENIGKTLEKKKDFKGERFTYDCPFLIDNVCSVYEHRGIICRSFGLMATIPGFDKKTKVPFCYAENLNYSNVIDFETKQVSGKRFKEGHFIEEPLAFNVSYDFLTGKDFEESFDFKFGEKKSLIDWFSDQNTNNSEENK